MKACILLKHEKDHVPSQISSLLIFSNLIMINSLLPNITVGIWQYIMYTFEVITWMPLMDIMTLLFPRSVHVV